MSETPQKPLVPDQPTVSRKFWIALLLTCVVSVLLELRVHRHEHFESSDSVFASAWLPRLLQRHPLGQGLGSAPKEEGKLLQ